MQIGDLSRTRFLDEQGDNAVRQAIRVLLVSGLMAGGSLALWLTAGSSAPSDGMVTAAPPQILAGEQHSVELPQRAERVQVANADPSASIAASVAPPQAAYVPASDPLPLTSEPAAFAPEPAEAAPLTDIDMTGTVAPQASLAEPARSESPAADLVDLNRASFEQLNSLKGAGALGRAIVKGRPYRSVDDLVKKKVLRRPIFEKIKHQVKVQ